MRKNSKNKRGRKGLGYIQEKNGYFYWRRKVNGKETSRRIFADSIEEVEKEVERLIAISQAKSEIELANFIGQAKNVIKEKSSLLINEAFEVFENNPT